MYLVWFWRISTHRLYTSLHNLIIVDISHCLIATHSLIPIHLFGLLCPISNWLWAPGSTPCPCHSVFESPTHRAPRHKSSTPQLLCICCHSHLLHPLSAFVALHSLLVLGIDQIGLGIIQLLRSGSQGVLYCWYFGYNTSTTGEIFIWYRWYYTGIIPLYNWYNW